MSLKNERDSSIQNLFARYNLGSLPKPPFSSEVVLNLTNRVKSRLGDLLKDLEDKKVTLLFSLFSYIYIYSHFLVLLVGEKLRNSKIFKDDFLLLPNIWDKGSFYLLYGTQQAPNI